MFRKCDLVVVACFDVICRLLYLAPKYIIVIIDPDSKTIFEYNRLRFDKEMAIIPNSYNFA